ncbi:hypothetical protein roselon_00184 [Roseibacterium elongatum DSM 19469]|uniref:Uncharacterized protein n=1 Tax=Roseicyclus elongatus DSM 19469 TaxID=1294273 RepID=W8S1N4_9RHOB|nr:hypothetical protein [Roseibacterium elongatum]AHM02641.1 hypothetical protein roselon_00184 [Roseibacterium elongatum DSM 19469]
MSSWIRIALVLALVLPVSGCGVGQRVSSFVGGAGSNQQAGLPYRARLSTGETRRDFTVTVQAGGASLDEARESARFPATSHCVDRYGTSAIDWVLDPATGDWAVTRTADGDLTVSGRCRRV